MKVWSIFGDHEKEGMGSTKSIVHGRMLVDMSIVTNFYFRAIWTLFNILTVEVSSGPLV